MQSRFITNYTDVTFLATIQANLRACKKFAFSVSFIKKAGLVLLANDIKSALERGAKGRLITSTYQNFTDVESLNFFLNLSFAFEGFECHLDDECFYNENNYSTNGFHTKGYLFEFDNRCELVVGSSNITRYALLKNIEWDLLVDCHKYDVVYQSALKEYEELWEHTLELTQERINLYAQKINFAIERWDMDYDLADQKVKPNYMQRKALKELNRNRAIGVNKSLIISATGSGKTYLAAFDALNFSPNRLLYVVHEGSILRRSLETFQKVFGGLKKCGMFSGEAKELDADFIFSTNVSMCRSLELFDKKDFDYIIIDECHHAVADTYRQIIDYFEPEFLLGLTATENRMDNKDVVEIFGNNIPYELRLRDAIINDLIVPFHYYGIRDELVDYGLTDSEERRLIAQISNEENCEFIYQQIENHRIEGQKLKALAFCRNIQHARMMADNLGEYYHTTFLSGKNKTGERIRAYNDLQSDNKELEILFAVDILNEGVDIPGVNMVLFLRPTESSTIFIQQLGRGLRKFANKNYVTILDFIGNSYKRSVHIALALGSLSKGYILEKKLLKTMVREDFKILGLEDYGVKINIDNLSKEEILHHIDNENFNQLNYLKKDYQNFKSYLKTPTFPKHMDYVNSDYAPNLLKFMKIKVDCDGKKRIANSYYGFLKGIGEDVPLFTEQQILAINYISSLLPLVRRHEFLIVKHMLDEVFDELQLRKLLAQEIDGYTELHFDHALRFMSEGKVVEKSSGSIHFQCSVDPEFKEYVSDLLEYGLSQYSVRYKDTDDFLLYQDYRQDQALLKILGNPKNNQKGTYYKNGNMYIFAGLKKDDSVQEHLNYKDKFLDNATFQWESIANITPKEESRQKESKLAYVFVRKVESENGITLPFTFVGTGQLFNPRKDATTNGSILYDIHMDKPLPDDLMDDFQWIA
jgi:superfamily II DNA or RNA helicase